MHSGAGSITVEPAREACRNLLRGHQPAALHEHRLGAVRTVHWAQQLSVHLLERSEFLVASRQQPVHLLVRRQDALAIFRRRGRRRLRGAVRAGEAEHGTERLPPLLRGRLPPEHARAHDLLLHLQLLLAALLHVPLDRRIAEQPDDPHLVGLPDAVHAGDGLLVVLRVPVQVEEDDGVRGLQIQTKTSGSRGEEEDADLLSALERLEVLPPLLVRHLPVQAHVPDLAPLEEGLQDVQDAGELGEDQHLVLEPEQLAEYPVQRLELAGGPVQILVMDELILEEVGVQRDLPQLHQRVVHLLAGHRVVVAEQPYRAALEVLVRRGLPSAQRHPHVDLRPRRQAVGEHVLLQAL
mmetsp:Transcript_56749/g.159326  ORF Transcript_56749/g.159326 Transcript_56749/m.159326 type:complete len:352 (-) Transcript_56749:947-2002(-)